MSFLFIFCCLQILVAQAEPANFGVAELLEEARKSQMAWRQASVAVEQAEAAVTYERSTFLPDLALTSSFSRDWESSMLGVESTGSQAAVVSRWSIFDNGTSYRNLSRRKLELERARVEEKRIREDVAYNVLQRYANYLLFLRQKQISEQKLELYRTQFRMSERQYRQELKTRNDNQRLEAEVERAQLSLLRFQERLKDSFEELQRYLGAESLLQNPESLKTQRTLELFKTFAAKSDLSGMPLESSPKIESAQLQLNIQKVLTREEKVDFWPGVNLSAQGGYGSDSFVDRATSFNDRDRFFASARLELSWVLFNWGGVSSQYRRALQAEKLSEAGLSQARLDVKSEQSRLQREGRLLQKSLSVLDNIHAIERRTFTDIETSYREGRASYLDLSTSLERRFQVELELEQEAVSSLLNSAAQRQLMGSLYEACLQL